MKYIFLPIEPLEERYSEQMLRWVTADFVSLGFEYLIVMPKKAYTKISHGQWLDTYGTSVYRSKQLEMVAELFQKGKVDNGDVFLIGDVWYPGIETIKFLAEMSSIKVKVVGWHYAGMFDPHDLLHRTLSPWASAWERWLVKDYLDLICVGSRFHRELIVEGASEDARKHILPLGLVWKPDEVLKYKTDVKNNIVVFPHRFAIEKQPSVFEQLAIDLSGNGWDFVYSTNNESMARHAEKELPHVRTVYHKTKKDYYKFLATCKIYYSAGFQETFGYSLHESIALGLCAVAPRRCSYVEGLRDDSRFLYDTERDPVGQSLLSQAMVYPVEVPYEYTEWYSESCVKFLEVTQELFV